MIITTVNHRVHLFPRPSVRKNQTHQVGVPTEGHATGGTRPMDAWYDVQSSPALREPGY